MFMTIIVLCISVLHISYGLYDPKDLDRWNTDFTQYQIKQELRGKEGFRTRASNGRVRVTARDEDYVTQEELDAAISKVNENMNIIIAEINSIENNLTDFSGQLDSLQGDMATVKSQQADERKPPPMFFGQLTDTVYDDHGEVYKFTTVQINEGSNYNKDDGKFTCDPTGWYFFTFSLYGYKLAKSLDHDLYGKLMKDDTEITSAYASNYMSGKNEWANLQASTSVLIKCNKGEKVYVAASDWNGSSGKTNQIDFVAMLVHKEE